MNDLEPFPPRWAGRLLVVLLSLLSAAALWTLWQHSVLTMGRLLFWPFGPPAA